jgi:pimeloyl-ACP methyl ester carboxylesterase
MRFKTFGDRNLPVIVMLHGGGLSWWSLTGIVELMKGAYHVVTPVIDGHGEDGDTGFMSIEDSAEKLIRHIDSEYEGEVHTICGLSLGAQIALEVLARRQNIAKYAVIESALVHPIKGVVALTVPTYKLFYGLVKQKWFSKMQAKTLFVPEDMFQQYYEDSLRISKESLINITISNGNYAVKDTLSHTNAKVLILVGEKELGLMKRSAETLHQAIPQSELVRLPEMGHGEISLIHAAEYVELLRTLFAGWEESASIQR